MSILSDFVHLFVPGDDDAVPVLALHGTGGDERDLLPLVRMISPRSPVLSPRGRVLENGMPRYFRRLAEGVFDQEDLRRRTGELGEFVGAAADEYGFDRRRLVAIGYSNGANIAASLLLSRGDALNGGVLLRPMVPFEPETSPDLSGKAILLSAGEIDPIIPPALTTRLAELLRAAGAEVTLSWLRTGHGLVREEIDSAAAWFAARFGA
jgi:phospholipase/carboxylesterase